MEEEWNTIPHFPSYMVSNYGDVLNMRTQQMMSISQNNHGHSKVSLVSESGTRHTRSVALLVAQAFVEAPNYLCDQVVVLDGDMSSVRADNLVWRPRWHAWHYTRQLKGYFPQHYMNLRVTNVTTNVEYSNIIAAGTAEGLLFDDIWRSTFSGSGVYPYRHKFEITERV